MNVMSIDEPGAEVSVPPISPTTRLPRSTHMEETEQRFWETIIKAVTAVVALSVAVVGLLQYQDVSHNNIANQKIERYKLKIERYNLLVADSKEQIKTLRETSTVVSTLTAQRRKTIPNKPEERFWQLYWSDLIGVENGEVEAGMVELGNVLLTSDKSGLAEKVTRVEAACLNQIKDIKKNVKPPSVDNL